jgi:excisionase family DNA binding protein
MTLTEAAATLGVTAATLRQQIAHGKLRAVKRGRDWWVARREVERYRAESRRAQSLPCPAQPRKSSGPAA